MFQYSYARLLAEANGLELMVDSPCPKIMEPTKPPEGKVVSGAFELVSFASLPLQKTTRAIHCHGFFQDENVFNEYRDKVRGFWKIDKPAVNTEDLVVHLRLTDYYWANKTGWNQCVISPQWYIDIIRKEKYRKLYIVVEPHVTNGKYLLNFRSLNPEIVSKSPAEDFHFIRSFDRIVCSNSTFCWWAAYLSNASKVWTFKKWMGKGHNLAYMKGATVLDGTFIRDRYLEEIDWSDYWSKPDSFFG
jgi:hypothetical protein